MTWHEALELLETQTVVSALQFASRPEHVPIGEPLLRVSVEEIARLDAEVDHACRVFAEDLTWPRGLSDHTMRECLSRLSQAAALARFVVEAGETLPPNHAAIQQDLPDAPLLRWLLIDYWHMAGMWREIFRLSTPQKPPA
jgi:hypothetical protein